MNKSSTSENWSDRHPDLAALLSTNPQGKMPMKEWTITDRLTGKIVCDKLVAQDEESAFRIHLMSQRGAIDTNGPGKVAMACIEDYDITPIGRTEAGR